MLFKKIFSLLLLAILLFAFYTIYSTGLLRSIDNEFSGTLVKHIEIPGAEDMQISYEDDFVLISSDDRAAHREGNAQQGHLYYIDLTDPGLQPVALTTDFKKPFFPHGISMINTGAQTYRVFAVNHIGEEHSIEVFDLYNDSLVHVQTLRDEAINSPNDIVAIDKDRFYFTNDHGYTKGIGKLGEEYLGWAVSNVMYYDGKKYSIVADGIAYANGINMDRKTNLLFVASPRDFLVKVYSAKVHDDLHFIEDIYCGTGVDNIEFDEKGKMWIGCHPSLLTYASYAKGKREYSPSEIITLDYRGMGDYNQEIIYLDDGAGLSATSVAASYKDLIFAGSVMDDHFLILRKN